MTIKNRLKNLLLAAPGFQALCRRLTRAHVRTVMYHRFSPPGQDHPRRLATDEFDWQLAQIARHYTNWTPDQHLAAITQSTPAPPRPAVVITVDDGYADFGTLALPLLQRHGLRAIVFLTTGFVAGCTWFWWDRLYWLLENTPAGEREFPYAGRTLTGDPADTASRWRIWHRIADRLSTIADDRKELALSELSATCGIPIPDQPPADYAALTWEQVREMSAAGVQFGAHTVNHPVLSRISADRAAREIRDSRTELAAATNLPVDWFCYPQGGPDDFDEQTVELVRQAGFKGCYKAFPDAAHDGNPLTLPRYSLHNDRVGFLWFMCGAEYLFERRVSQPRQRIDNDR